MKAATGNVSPLRTVPARAPIQDGGAPLVKLVTRPVPSLQAGDDSDTELEAAAASQSDANGANSHRDSDPVSSVPGLHAPPSQDTTAVGKAAGAAAGDVIVRVEDEVSAEDVDLEHEGGVAAADGPANTAATESGAVDGAEGGRDGDARSAAAMAEGLRRQSSGGIARALATARAQVACLSQVPRVSCSRASGAVDSSRGFPCSSPCASWAGPARVDRAGGAEPRGAGVSSPRGPAVPAHGPVLRAQGAEPRGMRNVACNLL